MADIKISGKKVLKTISREFQEQFPFLCIHFFTIEEWKKTQEGQKASTMDTSQKLAAVRTKIPGKDEKELSINGHTLVKNLENNFFKTYGLYAQVGCQKDGKRYYTAGGMDDMSLTQLNLKLEKEGYDKNPK